jgi:hypothetical protein
MRRNAIVWRGGPFVVSLSNHEEKVRPFASSFDKLRTNGATFKALQPRLSQICATMR